LLLLTGPQAWVAGDVAYFDASLSSVAERGLADTLVEYPLPGVGLIALPWLAARAIEQWTTLSGQYAVLLAGCALATDAAFLWLLHRSSTPTPRSGAHRGVWVWLLGVPLLGATAYARFDLLPGVLAGVALLLVGSHSRLSAAAVAIAAAAKLWPVLLLPALAARPRGRVTVVLTTLAIGAGLAGASVLLTGWGRLLSPLTWQQNRGLQVESVLATPAMLAWALDPGGHVVHYSDHNAYEVIGAGVPALLAACTVLTVVGGLLLGALWSRAWRHGAELSPDAVAWLCLSAVTMFLVTSKVLSPQYLLWLLPAAAAALAVARTDRGVRQLTRWAVVLLGATAATQVVFPLGYAGIVAPESWSLWVVLALTARNAALVWLLVHAVGETWWHLRQHAQRGSELDRQPPGPDGNAVRTLR
jgi:hypothetical protein